MLWTVVAAVFFSLSHHWFKYVQGMPYSTKVIRAIELIFEAGAVATLFFVLFWCWRYGECFRNVGHWLLVATTFFALFDALIRFADDLMVMWPAYVSAISLSKAFNLSEPAVLAAIFFFTGRFIAREVRWKLFCYLSGICYLVAATWGAPFYLQRLDIVSATIDAARSAIPNSRLPPSEELIAIISGCLCLVAFLGDIRWRRPMHWSSNAGILCWIAICTLTIVSYSRYVFRAWL